jgi:RecA-family ATPase
MEIQNEENYSVIYVGVEDTSEEIVQKVREEMAESSQFYWIIDYSNATGLTRDLLNFYDESLIGVKDHNGLVVVVDPSAANEDGLFAAIEFLPTVEEASDFIFMEQLERELGEE